MTGDGINHGSYGGYQKHRKLGVEACTECLAAQVWYARRRRESAEVRAEEKRQYNARMRAYVRLSRAYTAGTEEDGSDYGDEGSTA